MDGTAKFMSTMDYSVWLKVHNLQRISCIVRKSNFIMILPTFVIAAHDGVTGWKCSNQIAPNQQISDMNVRIESQRNRTQRAARFGCWSCSDTYNMIIRINLHGILRKVSKKLIESFLNIEPTNGSNSESFKYSLMR